MNKVFVKFVKCVFVVFFGVLLYVEWMGNLICVEFVYMELF